MNFKALLLTVYLFGEFEHNLAVQTTAIIQLPGDSEQQQAVIKSVYEKLYASLSYRYAAEEMARIRTNIHINKYESKMGTKYTDSVPVGHQALKFWKPAQAAEIKYKEIQRNFVMDKFFSEPDTSFCTTVIEDPYFKDAKLTLDPAKASSHDCAEITFTFWNEKWYGSAVNFKMRYRKCYAIKKKDDNSEVPINFYVQSAYKKPALGRMKYFVLYGYIWNKNKESWEMATHPNIKVEDITFRYEAYLTFGVKKSKMMTLPWM